MGEHAIRWCCTEGLRPDRPSVYTSASPPEVKWLPCAMSSSLRVRLPSQLAVPFPRMSDQRSSLDRNPGTRKHLLLAFCSRGALSESMPLVMHELRTCFGH